MNLNALSCLIDEVEKTLTRTYFKSSKHRVSNARTILQSCPDDNLRHLLALAVGYSSNRPNEVFVYLKRARDHVATLRENRGDDYISRL